MDGDGLQISKKKILGNSVQTQNQSSSVAENKNNIFGDKQTNVFSLVYFGHFS
jgi:hypothetical protein